jgi:hypothetical protein
MFTRESRMEDMFGRYFEPEELGKDEDEWCRQPQRGNLRRRGNGGLGRRSL